MIYIERDEQLLEVAERLNGVETLAVDTEAAGYHRYHDRACLVQMSTRTETFLVDPFVVKRMDALSHVLGDAGTEVIFHDADYDLRLLDRDFGLRVHHLFDTKIAAQLLGEPAIGLGALAEKFLGIKMEKKHQRADWAQRPLTQDMLDYAAEDTRHLPALRDALHQRLVETGRLEWAEEEFEIGTQVRWETEEDGEAFLRMKNTRDLKPRELAALRELHAWRERVAEERDVATFRVIGNDSLIEMARRMPENANALEQIPGMSRYVQERHGRDLLAAIQHARGLKNDELPVRPRGPGRPPPDPELEAAVDRLKEARDVVAKELGLDRGFLMPRAQLELIARERPWTLDAMRALPGFRRWQVEAAGEALLDALEG